MTTGIPLRITMIRMRELCPDKTNVQNAQKQNCKIRQNASLT